LNFTETWHQKNVKFVTKVGFSRRLISEYFFIESGGNLVCLVSQRTVSVMKEYNIKRHYESKNKGKFYCLTGELMKRKISNLKTSLVGQQDIFNVKFIRNESGVRASCVVAEIIAKAGRPFTDSEFVKQSILAVTVEVCPDKKNFFLRRQPLCPDLRKACRITGSKFI
jgi:hypothetical protein